MVTRRWLSGLNENRSRHLDGHSIDHWHAGLNTGQRSGLVQVYRRLMTLSANIIKGDPEQPTIRAEGQVADVDHAGQNANLLLLPVVPKSHLVLRIGKRHY